MVVRRLWYQSLENSERDAHARVAELRSGNDDAPVDLEQIATRLGARIRRKPTVGDRHGVLTRDGSKWIVGVEEDPVSLGPDSRFIVAHEFAHILLLESGLPGPSSEREYWILEEACDRVGNSIIAPPSISRNVAFESEDVLAMFSELAHRWLLRSIDAAKLMYQSVSNLIAAASLLANGGQAIVDWSLGSERYARWPKKGESVIDGPIAELTSQVYCMGTQVESIPTYGGYLIGIDHCEPRHGVQLQLQSAHPQMRDSSVMSSHRTIVFYLLDSESEG